MRYLLSVTSSTDRCELKIRVLHKAMSVKLYEIEESRLERGSEKTGWSQRVNCFSILASYWCEIPKNMSGIRHKMIEQINSFI